MRKTTMTKRLLALTVAACWLAAAPATADCPAGPPADPIYVDVQDVNCLDLVSGGTGSEAVPFCSIQDAFDRAVALGTNPADVKSILVKEGDYPECVVADTNAPCNCCTKGFPPPTPGCDCPTCEAEVCALDGFCCGAAGGVWDAVCDDLAVGACTCCAGQPAGTCTDDIENRPVRLVAEAWLNAGSPDPDPADTSGFETIAMKTKIVCGVSPASALTIAGTDSCVEGFAITGATTAGIDARGSVTLANNLIHDNQGELGGGVRLSTGVCAWASDILAETPGDFLVTATISHNVVRDNLADDFSEFGAGDGGGLFIAADGYVTGTFVIEPEPTEYTDCFGGRSEVTIADNVITGNTAQNLNIDFVANDTFASGGGIAVETFAGPVTGTGEDTAAHVRVSRNTVTGNTVSAGQGFAFGGGIASTTFGPGRETIELESNIVGMAPDQGNVVVTGVGVVDPDTPVQAAFGGGISAQVTPAFTGFHEITVDGNSLAQNNADFGGGLDLLLDVIKLFQDQSARLVATENTVDSNASDLDGGGSFKTSRHGSWRRKTPSTATRRIWTVAGSTRRSPRTAPSMRPKRAWSRNCRSTE
jgi:hypothetical protein